MPQAPYAVGWVETAAPVPARSTVPPVPPMGWPDVRAALRLGVADFGANRTDVVFLCILYPVLGLLMAQFVVGAGILPVLFPLLVGFVLVGPIAAVGLQEMSRRREAGEQPSWRTPFSVLRAPSFPAIIGFAVMLAVIFAVWMVTAQAIFTLTMGGRAPVSLASFVHDLLLTGPGWALIVLGVGIGFGFALGVLAISVVTFPILLDRRVSLATAIGTSVGLMRTHPRVIVLWGLTVAVSLLLGSLPALLGLPFVLPILGHASWHLYRRVVSG